MTRPSSKLRIWLFRHGETEWAKTGQHTGLNDLPLNAAGEQQAQELAGILAGRHFEKVLCSPLRRAQQTCEMAGYLSVAEIVPAMHEWNYGAYAGRTSAEIAQEVPGWNIWQHGVRDGETIEQVAERARGALAIAQAVEGDVAMFAHGHFLRILATQWLGVPARDGRLLAMLPAAISILGFEGPTPAIRAWNWRPQIV